MTFNRLIHVMAAVVVFFVVANIIDMAFHGFNAFLLETIQLIIRNVGITLTRIVGQLLESLGPLFAMALILYLIASGFRKSGGGSKGGGSKKADH